MTYPVSAYPSQNQQTFNSRRGRPPKPEHSLNSRIDTLYRRSNERKPLIYINPLRLTKEIMSSSSEELLNLFQQNIPFNSYHITAAITHTSKSMRSMRFKLEKEDALWKHLISRLPEMLKNPKNYFDHRSLCNISYAIATKIKNSKTNLTETEVSVFKLIADKVTLKFNRSSKKFDRQNLSTLVSAFCIVCKKNKEIFDLISLKNTFFESIANEIEARDLEYFEPQAISMLAFSFAKLKKNPTLLREFAFEIDKRSKSFNGLKFFRHEELSMLAQAFHYANRDDFQIFENIAWEIYKRTKEREGLREFTPSSLSCIARAFLNADRTSYSIFENIAKEVDERSKGSKGLYDFTPETLSYLAWTFSCVNKNPYGIFENIAMAVGERTNTHDGLRSIGPNYLVMLVEAFYFARKDYGIFKYTFDEVRKKNNDLADFNLHELTKLANIFFHDRQYHRIYNNIAYAVKKRATNPTELDYFKPKDLSTLARIFSDLKIYDHEVFKHIAMTLNQESRKSHLRYFKPCELAHLAGAFSRSNSDYGIFEDIAHAVKQKRERNELDDFKPYELVKLQASFILSGKNFGLFEDISHEIKQRIKKPKGFSIFTPKEIALLLLNCTSVMNYTISAEILKKLFNEEIDFDSKGITYIFYAIVRLIIAKKIEKIPDEWLQKFKEREKEMTQQSNSSFESSVRIVLNRIGSPQNFTPNEFVFFKINEYPLRLYEVDFINRAKKQIIEVDGSSHSLRRGADTEKEATLKNLGYSVLRIDYKEWNKRSNTEKEEYLREQLKRAF